MSQWICTTRLTDVLVFIKTNCGHYRNNVSLMRFVHFRSNGTTFETDDVLTTREKKGITVEKEEKKNYELITFYVKKIECLSNVNVLLCTNIYYLIT